MYGVVLAGGTGTRLWPKSRATSPKQLFTIAGMDKNLLQLAFERLHRLPNVESSYLVTRRDQFPLMEESLPTDKQVIPVLEPEGKNTLPALVAASFLISNRGGGLLLSCHADHIIGDPELFEESINAATELAQQGHLALIGMKPTYPSTDFGYIEAGSALGPGFSVAGFREKPPREEAEKLYKKSNFFWNSGIFLWDVNIFLGEVERYQPKLFQTMSQAIGKNADPAEINPAQLERAYQQLEGTSVDVGILEKSQRIAIAPGSFSWNDVGNWDSISALCSSQDNTGNSATGKAHFVDCQNVYVENKDIFVGVVGLKDVVVVSTPQGILVTHKDKAAKVKEVAEVAERNSSS